MPASTVAATVAGITRASKAPDKPQPHGRPVLLVGGALAAWTVLLGLAVLVCLSLAAWVSAAHQDDSAGAAIVVAAQAWLLAQHGAIDLGGSGTISLVPLGLTAALAALASRGGRLTARHSGANDLVDVAAGVAVYAVCYAVIAALLTAATRLGDARPVALQVLVGAFLLAAVGGGFGALRETGTLERIVDRIPSDLRAMFHAGAAAGGVLAGAGALLFALGMVIHGERVGRLAGSLHGGAAGAVLLVVMCAAYLPNAVIWAVGYCVGPGFAVGAGTSVALTGAHLGAVPSFPLLAPLPDAGPAPWWAWPILAGPVAAGVLAGWLLARSLPVSQPRPRPAADVAGWPWWRGWAWARLREALPALAAGVVATVLVVVASALAGGSLGGAHLRTLGPSPWRVGAATFVLVGVAAAATVWLYGWWRQRTAGARTAA